LPFIVWSFLASQTNTSTGLKKRSHVKAFTIFNPTVLAMLEAVPALRGDPLLANTNEGVTVL